MSSGFIPLIRAAADGDAGAVKKLLAGGADVNARTPVGDTALIRAAFFGHTEVVRILLDAGADARARDGYDLTAYEWAVRKGLYDVARLIREYAPADAPPAGDTAKEQPRRVAAREEGGRDASRSAGRGAGTEAAERAEGGSAGGAAEREDRGQPTDLGLKRCPKCNRTYRSDILAYCIHDAVKLVSGDAPPEVERENGARPWVWALVTVALVAGVYAGYRINKYGAEVTAPPSEAESAVRRERPVTGGALKGKEVSLPDPQYTAETEGEAATGEVKVEVKVDKEGAVIWARAVSGPAQLQPAAVKAALESKFSPGIPARRAASAAGTITYTFK
jgi:TonB family protein